MVQDYNVSFLFNLQILLPAANLLQIIDVKEACCDFLVTQLHPSNCLGIRAFADLHCCVDLLNLADKYTFQHFRLDFTINTTLF